VLADDYEDQRFCVKTLNPKLAVLADDYEDQRFCVCIWHDRTRDPLQLHRHSLLAPGRLNFPRHPKSIHTPCVPILQDFGLVYVMVHVPKTRQDRLF
jgi:hypothetical protein